MLQFFCKSYHLVEKKNLHIWIIQTKLKRTAVITLWLSSDTRKIVSLNEFKSTCPKLFYLMCRQCKTTARGSRQQLSHHCFLLIHMLHTFSPWSLSLSACNFTASFELKLPITPFSFKVFSSVLTKKELVLPATGKKISQDSTASWAESLPYQNWFPFMIR